MNPKENVGRALENVARRRTHARNRRVGANPRANRGRRRYPAPRVDRRSSPESRRCGRPALCRPREIRRETDQRENRACAERLEAAELAARTNDPTNGTHPPPPAASVLFPLFNTGSETLNSVRPGWDSTSIVPSSDVTIRRLMSSPSPVPCPMGFRRKERIEDLGLTSGGIPEPLSAMRTTTANLPPRADGDFTSLSRERVERVLDQVRHTWFSSPPYAPTVGRSVGMSMRTDADFALALDASTAIVSARFPARCWPARAPSRGPCT